MRRIVILASVLAACGAPPSANAPRGSAPTKREGAVLLASPGKGAHAFVVAGAPQDVVRGRVRWRVDADGAATRARIVTRDPTTSALRLPSWLGGGVALIGDGGVSIVDGSGAPRPLLRGAVTSPSIGAHELWLRAHKIGEGDWLRVPGATSGLASKMEWAPPPISAPILAAYSSIPPRALVGRPLTTGPEFVSPKVAFALVDLLGPVTTNDAGETWRPLDAPTIESTFGVTGATRVVRLANAVALANDRVIAPLSPTGQLGAATPLSDLREPAADVATIRLENTVIHGVPLDEGRVLVADGGRFAEASLDPVRVLHVARSNELTRCELRASPTKNALALAACTQLEEGATSAGAQLVIGPIDEGAHGEQLVAERVLPLPTAFRFSSTGAIVLAGACSSADAGGVDFTYASKVCVRDGAGKWRESLLAGIASRIDVVPRLDGGVVVARTDANKHLELVAVPAGATMGTVPTRLRVDVEPSTVERSLVAIDEIARDRLVVWRRIGGALEALTVSTANDTLKIVARAPAIKIDDAVYGVFGDHALVAAIDKSIDGKPRVGVVKITRDAGAHWEQVEWPDSARPLEAQTAGRIECGALGCRLFGWTRVGWQRAVASADDVVDLAGAPEIPAISAPPPRVSRLRAKCLELGAPTPFDAQKVPVDRPSSDWGPMDKSALLGMPEPKMAPGFSLESASLGHGAVRGAVLAWGPTNGAWSDLGRMVVRFTTDLDEIGVAHETTPVPSPFADRNAFQRARTGLDAYALAPGRALLADCTLGRCTRFWRAIAGQPLQKVDLDGLGEVVRIVNARELGDTLMIVGLTIPREKQPISAFNGGAEKMPFVALVSPTGAVSTTFARAPTSVDERLVGTIDFARGRFGVAILSALPSWQGGATYVLPLRADAKPSGTFEALGPGSTDVVHPERACSSTTAGWDRGDAARMRSFELETPSGTTTFAGQGTTIRERLSPTGACLDRFTLLGPASAAQLDPATGATTTLVQSADGKTATKHRYTCADLEWE